MCFDVDFIIVFYIDTFLYFLIFVLVVEFFFSYFIVLNAIWGSVFISWEVQEFVFDSFFIEVRNFDYFQETVVYFVFVVFRSLVIINFKVFFNYIVYFYGLIGGQRVQILIV